MKTDTAEKLRPGEELAREGLADLKENRLTDSALLVLVAAPRLRRLGIEVPNPDVDLPVEHRLYEQLESRLGAGAHSYYNSLIRRIVSYSRALEREQSRRDT